MYSMVLLVAMTGGSEAPNFFHGGHGGGCCGNSGCGCCGNYSGCGSSSCGCCGNYSSCGCWGGGGGGLFHHHGGGGCGCCGNYSSCGCCGNYSSCGGCGNYSGCGGCGGYGGYYGAPGGGRGGEVIPLPQGSGKDGSGKTGGSGEISAPATIVVTVPENAKLMLDDYVIKSTSATRTLETPTLLAGRNFSYTLTMEVVRDGKTVTQSKQITVRAGQTTESKFELATAAAE
jgi:uncharacterized protein (TIGR03000 family)